MYILQVSVQNKNKTVVAILSTLILTHTRLEHLDYTQVLAESQR